MKKLKVAAYCRVSTDRDEQINSLESQKNYFRGYIESHPDWELIEVYYDEGISGTQTQNRSGFHQMIQAALGGKVDLILTKEVSRFARNTVDTLSFTRKLKEQGVGVLFTIDNIDTREPDGELRLTIMASIAQEESRKTSERVKWGQKRKMEAGVVFGRDLLGYTVKHGTLIKKEEEVPVVKAIFQKYTNEGKGTHVIARELEEEGLRPKHISMWSHTVILRILRNEKYVGDLCQKKTITPNYLTHKKKYNRGEESLIYLSNHHEPIINRDLWERTQEELRNRSPDEVQKKKHSNRYWCSGKLECGMCGRSFVSRKKRRKDGSVYRAWRCYAAANHGTRKKDLDGNEIGCGNQSYNEQSLLVAVQYCVRHLPIDFIKLNCEMMQEIRKTQNLYENETNKEQEEKKIEALQEKKRKVLDLLLSGVLTDSEAREQKAWYDKKIEEVETQKARYRQDSQIRRSQLDKIEEWFTKSEEWMDCSVQGTMTELALSYREILEKIVLYPGGKMQVFLKGLPWSIHLEIRTSGKGKWYRTEIINFYPQMNSQKLHKNC
jgi:DNA invertase Pin-like site-specific DNA recombinase